MRRPPPTAALKPSLLKHFLLISIALTGCIAIFANGENGKLIQEQIKERQAKNQALLAEKQAGKTRVVGGMVIARGTNIDADSSGEPAGPFSDSDSGVGESAYSPPVLENQKALESPFYNGRGPIDPNSGLPKPGGKPKVPPKLTDGDVQRILAASRARSGAPVTE